MLVRLGVQFFLFKRVLTLHEVKFLYTILRSSIPHSQKNPAATLQKHKEIIIPNS